MLLCGSHICATSLAASSFFLHRPLNYSCYYIQICIYIYIFFLLVTLFTHIHMQLNFYFLSIPFILCYFIFFLHVSLSTIVLILRILFPSFHSWNQEKTHAHTLTHAYVQCGWGCSWNAMQRQYVYATPAYAAQLLLFIAANSVYEYHAYVSISIYIHM